MQKLNIDNLFFEMMGRLGDVIIVNVLFIICSLLIVTMGAGCLLSLWELVFAWIFPLMAQRELRGKEAVKEAFRMGVLRLPATLLMIVLNNILLVCLVLDLYYVLVLAPFYLAFGFGATAYVNVKIMKKRVREER